MIYLMYLINLENIEDDIEQYYSGDTDTSTEDDNNDNSQKKKRLIECSARIMLPFPEDVAFDAFSDLTRQP